MLKKRLIFTLLVEDGSFMLSRNFTLQRGGDLDWLKEHYDFDSIAFSIDELVVLNVNRGDKKMIGFAALLKDLTKGCFIPIAAGGGIRSMEDAELLLASGADKLIVNTPLLEDEALITALVKRYGSQCVVASIDYKDGEGKEEAFIGNGQEPTGLTVAEAVKKAEALGVGEILLTSMTKDGTGQGLELDLADKVGANTGVPIIVAGGAGNFDQLSQALHRDNIAAVATANIFNFMSDNLTEARKHIVEDGTPLAIWESRLVATAYVLREDE